MTTAGLRQPHRRQLSKLSRAAQGILRQMPFLRQLTTAAGSLVYNVAYIAVRVNRLAAPVADHQWSVSCHWSVPAADGGACRGSVGGDDVNCDADDV